MIALRPTYVGVLDNTFNLQAGVLRHSYMKEPKVKDPLARSLQG